MDNASRYRGWYDVQDSRGVWRLGRCTKTEGKVMTIHLDGWSNKFDTMHCEHSSQLAAPRTHTKGLTTQLPIALREPIEDFQQVMKIHNKLKLLLNSSPEELEVEEIVAFFRIELLVMIDALLTLPFDFSDIHKGLEINKFFFDIVNLIVKVLERCSNFLQTPQNPKHKALQDACYELFLLARSVFGLSPRYERFFSNPQNMFIKRDAIIESFLKSEGGGLLLINSYIRNVTAHCQSTLESFETHSELLKIVMELYEGRLLPEEQYSRLNLVIDSISAFLKAAVKCEQVYTLLTTTSQGKYLTNTLENMYIKLKPLKKFHIDQILGSEEARKKKRKGSEDSKEAKQPEMKSTFIVVEKPKGTEVGDKAGGKRKKTGDEAFPPAVPTLVKNAQISKLEERMAKLEQQLAQQSQSREKDLLFDFLQEHAIKPSPSLEARPEPVTRQEFDFNELSFLSALQFHLSNGNEMEANRLISWRKKILQLSAIVGWDIAMVVAKNTQHRLTVETSDILSTNLDYLRGKYNL